MSPLLGTDPGAWQIIGWILVLTAAGAVVLFLFTALLLRERSIDPPDERTPGRA